MGLFLKLKNNSGANGFRYQDIRDGSHNWGDNCLVEIYSPVKELHSDDRLYYEIGDTYRTVRTEDGLLLHEVNDILLTEGDVYFRSAAVNFRDYNNGTQSYEDIIIDDDLSDPAFDYNNFVPSKSKLYLDSGVELDDTVFANPNILL